MQKKTNKLLLWQNEKTIPIIKKSIYCDKLSIVSTDTTFGFLGNTSKKSFDLINKIKGDRSNKPYLVLIASINKLAHFVDTTTLSPQLYNLINKSWPGPVTFILRAKKEASSFLTSDKGTIALRCPDHDGLLSLLQSFDGLFSTSANQSNRPVPTNLSEIDEFIQNNVEYIVIDEGKGHYTTTPSTLLDCSRLNNDGKEEIHVIRHGAYPIEDLEKLYGSTFYK